MRLCMIYIDYNQNPAVWHHITVVYSLVWMDVWVLRGLARGICTWYSVRSSSVKHCILIIATHPLPIINPNVLVG